MPDTHHCFDTHSFTVCMKTGDSLFSMSSIEPKEAPKTFSLPVFVGLDYHRKSIQVCASVLRDLKKTAPSFEYL